MAPTNLDPVDEYTWEEDYFEDNLFSSYSTKATPASDVIWKDFYKQIYKDMISPHQKSSRSGGATSRQDYCFDEMYPGYSSVEVSLSAPHNYDRQDQGEQQVSRTTVLMGCIQGIHLLR